MSNFNEWFADRFIDDTVANDTQLSPISGYQSQPIVSLEKALESVRSLFDDLIENIKVAKERCHYPNEHGLTNDQSASIYLYTMEWGNGSFYRVLNAALRTQDRSTLKKWFAFLKLFDTALKKLPNLKQNVWRGVRSAGKECKKGDELIWWGINSCSWDVHVIEHFLTVDSTLFLIEAMNARDITGYTNYPNEHEVILLPGIRLHVVANSMKHTGGLHVTHLREVNVCETEYTVVKKNSAHKQEIMQVHSSQSKIVAQVRRMCLKQSCWAIVAIVILIGIVIGVTVGIVTRNKNSATETLRASDSMTVALPTTLPKSKDLVLDSTSTRNDSITPCPSKYPLVGFVYCQQGADVLSCASTDCDRVSVVYACGTYSSDCYVIGQVITKDGSSNKWYRLNLRAGGYGYVNGVYCFGNLDSCR